MALGAEGSVSLAKLYDEGRESLHLKAGRFKKICYFQKIYLWSFCRGANIWETVGGSVPGT